MTRNRRIRRNTIQAHARADRAAEPPGGLAPAKGRRPAEKASPWGYRVRCLLGRADAERKEQAREPRR